MKDASAGRKLAALACGSLTILAISVLVIAAVTLAGIFVLGHEGYGLGMLAGALVAFWLCPGYFHSRASDAIYRFWFRVVAGMEI